MIELEKVWDVLNTDEGKVLLAEYIELFLNSNYPVDYVKENEDDLLTVVTAGVVQGLSESNVPDGVDIRDHILGKLKENIAELKADNEEFFDPNPTVTESIPPRPLPNGSRYLNPEEVKWLVKYDPMVGAAANRAVRNMRKESADGFKNMSDDAIIEIALKNLYKLNRRDPELVAKLSGVGPSFFKPYEEGTPEEIVVRYFDITYGGEESKTTPYKSTETPSKSKSELIKQKKKNIIWGIIFLFVFWPVGAYLLYEAYQLSKEIDSK